MLIWKTKLRMHDHKTSRWCMLQHKEPFDRSKAHVRTLHGLEYLFMRPPYRSTSFAFDTATDYSNRRSPPALVLFHPTDLVYRAKTIDCHSSQCLAVMVTLDSVSFLHPDRFPESLSATVDLLMVKTDCRYLADRTRVMPMTDS